MTITTTTSQDRSFWQRFFEEMMDRDITWVLEWVRVHFEITDIFGADEIERAARGKCRMDDIFTFNELEEWALDNGFVKE